MGDSRPLASAPTSQTESNKFHRGRRRGAPERALHAVQNGNIHGTGSRGARNDRPGRGKGYSNHNRIPISDGALGSNHARPPDQSSDPTKGPVPSTTTSSGRGKEVQEASLNTTEKAVDDSVEGDVCFICASTIEHTSIAPCNHQTCHICSLRLRALYKTRACAHCRVSETPETP